MAKNRKGTQSILIDLHYKYSMNRFEEFYGDTVSYSEVEQVSYIDLKEMVFELIDRSIKFRKFGRDKKILTVKMDVTPEELNEFTLIQLGECIDEDKTNDVDENPGGIIKYKKFNFLHDFTVSNIREITNAERLKFKKAIIESEDENSEDESDEEDYNDDNENDE